VIVLNGFSVFSDKEKIALLKRLSEHEKVIILTDSDKAGMFIRNKLKGYINPDSIINLYIPRVAGKEKRKTCSSKEGILGVEGTNDGTLRALLGRFSADTDGISAGTFISNAQFYADGFSGGPESEKNRKLLAKELNLPENMTSKALLEAINMLVTSEEYERAKKKINNE
jgi:ribonuclease M5